MDAWVDLAEVGDSALIEPGAWLVKSDTVSRLRVIRSTVRVGVEGHVVCGGTIPNSLCGTMID
jgi:hypothetical protein